MKKNKTGEENYRTFFNNSTDFLFVLDMQGCIIEANQTVYSRLKYTEKELEGQSVLILHPLERREEAAAIVDKMLKGEAEFCPVPVISKDNVQIPVETRITKGLWNGQPALFGVSRDISVLKLSEEKFSKAFYLNPAICGVNEVVSGKYTEVNDAFIDILGFTKDEVIGRTASELGILIPETLSHLLSNMAKNGKLHNCETTVRTKNGGIRNVIMSAENFYIQDKQYRYTVAHDITERKQMEGKLINSEKIYRQLVNNTDTGFVVIDEKGCVVEANEPYLKIAGFKSVEDIIGHSVLEWTAPDEVENNAKAVNLCSQQGYIQDFETVYQHPDGKRINIIIQASLYEFDNTKKHIVSYCRDITERKKTEKIILESNALIEAVVENVPLMIFLKEATDLRFVIFNRAGEELLGYDRKDMLGKNDLDFFPLEQAENFISKDRDVLDGKAGILDIPEEPILTANKGMRLLHTRKVSIRGADGKTKYLLGISEDITERKQAEEEIKLKNEQLLKINAEKDKFFSIIAHDLRSPFSGFLRLTDVMVKKLDSMPFGQIQQLMKLLNESATNLLNLLENLLEWANVQRDSIEFKQETVQLSDIVQHAIEQVKEGAGQKEIGLHTDIPKNLKIFADIRMAESILRNLVSNAVKFTPSKGVVFISAKTLADNLVEVSVKDSGIGMSEILLNNLFRIDSKVTRPGTDGESSSGLGLLLCKEFIEKHGGIISVESKTGKGSTFSFTIPSGEIENT